MLLALIFAVGTGQALTSPTWQTLQPELVTPAERPQAISLGAVNQNLARAVGPAIGGLLLAATSAGTVFLANAATFLAVIAVIWWWRSTRPANALPREHVGEAIRAGGRYVAASPALRAILVRAGLFTFFASSVWALLPLTLPSAWPPSTSGCRRHWSPRRPGWHSARSPGCTTGSRPSPRISSCPPATGRCRTWPLTARPAGRSW